MQDEQQYEQLILQYTQLKNGAEDISRMIDNEDYDSVITMLKAREQTFINCQCIRNYLELTPVQKRELDTILDELRTLEMQNIKKMEKNMDNVQVELAKSQITQKIQQAYDFDENDKGSIVNIQE